MSGVTGLLLSLLVLYMFARAFYRPAVVNSSKTFAAATSRSTARMNSTIAELKTLAEFNKTIMSDKLTLVDFYATWCGPCKAVAPVLEQFAQQYPGVQFKKVDVDQSESIAMEYGVTAMPTFILFKKNEPVGKIVGANINAIKKALETYK